MDNTCEERIKMTSYEFRERVGKYRAFENHPLKDKYFEEKKKLTNSINNNKKLKKLSIVRLILIIMIPVYFFLFIESATDGGFITTILGIANIAGIILITLAKNQMIKDEPTYKAFVDKYKELGVIEFTQSDVEKGACIDEEGCCAVTQRSLSVEEREKCRQAHCHKCKTFMKAAYGYTEDYFSSMEMIHD